jgi:hypothetical protein
LAGDVQYLLAGGDDGKATGTSQEVELERSEKGDAMNRKTPTLVGAAVGLAAFLAIALLPALLYGGYAGVLLAGGIFGTPVEPTFLARALIVFGMVMGVTAVGSLFAVAGAAMGAAVSALTSPLARPAEQKNNS